MGHSKKIVIFGFLLCLCLTACGRSEVPSGVRGEARNEVQSEARDDVASDITAEVTGAKNYTKYADYEPTKADPGSLSVGDNQNILIAYFSRSGNTAIPEDVDAISSASLNISGDGNSIGNAEQIAKWIAEETGGDLFLIQT